MLEEFIKKFRTVTKSLEVIYVIEDAKKVSRIIVDENEVPSINDFLKKYNLKTVLSDFKIKKDIDNNRKFSDKGIKINKNSEMKGNFFMYVSKSKDMAEKAKELEENNKHKGLGLLLGYPQCCAGFFEKNFPVESKKKNDYTLATLKNSKGFIFSFHNNIAIRHMDLTLLSHFPCSFHCEASKEIAKRHLGIIKKHSKDFHVIFKGMLKGAVIYTENNGVFLLRDTKLKDKKLFYNKIMSSVNNGLYNELKNSDYIEIINKNNVKLTNKELNKIGFMLFI